MLANMKVFKKIDFFKHLDEEHLASISAKTIFKQYKKGSILFFEGEMPKSLIFLIKGQLKLYKTDPKGNEIVIHHFSPYSPIAEIVVLEELPYPASAVFETDGEVILLKLKNITDAISRDSTFAFALIRSLSHKIKYLEHFIDMNIILDSSARAAKYLIRHENDFEQLKKNVIARELNITPETFSRILKKFKALQLIEEKDHRLAIKNKEGLKVLYEV